MRATFVALIAVLSCTAIVIAFVVSNGSGREVLRTERVTASQAPSTDSVCDQITSGIECVPVPGSGAAVLIVRQNPKRSGPLVLWDLGGPGTPLMAPDLLRKSAPEFIKDLDIGVVVEPWALNAATASRCAARSASTQCVKALSIRPSSVKALPSTLRKARGVGIAGIYAESFGAVRLMPMYQSVLGAGGFVVLNAPAPVPSQDASAMLRGRWNRALKSLQFSAKQQARGSIPFEQFAGQSGMGRVASQAALLSLAYRADRNRKLVQAVARGKAMPIDRTRLRKLSVQYQLLDGRGGHLPAYTGYIAQICPTYSGWTGRRQPVAALRRLHRPCRETRVSFQTAYSKALQELRSLDGTGRSLVITNVDDPVVSHDEQQVWVRLLDAKVVTNDYPGHGALQGRTAHRVAGALVRKK